MQPWPHSRASKPSSSVTPWRSWSDRERRGEGDATRARSFRVLPQHATAAATSRRVAPPPAVRGSDDEAEALAMSFLLGVAVGTIGTSIALVAAVFAASRDRWTE